MRFRVSSSAVIVLSFAFLLAIPAPADADELSRTAPSVYKKKLEGLLTSAEEALLLRTPGEVRRGELWWADLNPVHGSEQADHRPVLVFQNDEINRFTTCDGISPS